MLIAIDEVGDFASYSNRYNFMVAAILTRRNNGIAVKQAQFEAWKATIDPSKLNNQNEVKGTALSDGELLRFTNEVIISNPIVNNVQIRIKPSENSTKLVSTFRDIEIKLLKLVQDHFKGLNDDQGVEFYGKLSRWVKDRNFQHYMKMAMLQNCITRSVGLAMGVSIIDWATGDDANLMNMAIKIDMDFVRKPGEKKFFIELLGQAFRQETAEHPIPMARELIEANHPFVQRYMLPGGLINLAEVFNNRLDFLPSHYHFELQIADILGAILHRSHNKNTCLDSVELINNSLPRGRQIKTHMILNPAPDADVRLEFDNN